MTDNDSANKPSTKNGSLTISSYTSAGKNKSENQDALTYHDNPSDRQLTLKGAVFAVADGISSSEYGAQASQVAVTGFLSDYLDTPETWSVKTSGYKVLSALNSWLVAQSRQGGRSFNRDKGYVCAFAALIIKSRKVHIFNTGDVRVLMHHNGAINLLTEEHRQVYDHNCVYLSAALGLDDHMRLDYTHQNAQIGADYLLLSDGVHEYVSDNDIITLLQSPTLFNDNCAQYLCNLAVSNGSTDDVSALIVRIEALPDAPSIDLLEQNKHLLPATSLNKGDEIDGLHVLRPLTTTPRSHTYLVKDDQQNTYVLKTPSAEKSEDTGHIEAMLIEEWVARRLNNPHLMTAPNLQINRTKLYTLTHYIEAQSLAQWMAEHPEPSLNQVRIIVSQIAQGLQALHRAEIIHRDLRPENILIDNNDTVTIIDFGEVSIAGLTGYDSNTTIPGSLQYAAPEYLLGEQGNAQSDVFSLGVLTYQMLSGHLPFGLKLSNANSKKALQQLKVRPLIEYGVEIPDWAAYSINKALSIDPKRRYAEVAEFEYELNHPSPDFKPLHKVALLERDPIRFWQGLSFCLFTLVLALLIRDYL